MKKYAVVTGSSPSSIGFLAAQKLSKMKNEEGNKNEYSYQVILACRNPTKGQQAQDLISQPNAQYMQLDLSSQESIRNFCTSLQSRMKEQDGELSVLINNAGVGWGNDTPYIETMDGLEEIVGVNHFGTFLLTYLLLDDLKKATNGARVVTVSSGLHDPNQQYGNKKGDDDRKEDDAPTLLLPDGINSPILLQSSTDYDGAKAYAISKLCNLFMTYELQRRLGKDTKVAANAISPGWIPSTGLARRSGGFGLFVLRYVLDPWRYLGMGITESPERGAQCMVQAAICPVASKGGEYFQLPKGEDMIKAVPSSEESLDPDKAKALWELSLKTWKL